MRELGRVDAPTCCRHRLVRVLRRRSIARLITVCLATTVGLVVSTAPAWASTLPPQGLYESCYPGDQPSVCDARLQLMGSAGFTVVLNYWLLYDSDAQQVLAYVRAAQAAGMKVIWPLNDFWSLPPGGNDMLSEMPGLAATCRCSTNQGMTDYIVSLAKSQPNTWGYYVADEPAASQVGQVQAFNDNVRAVDPNHPTVMILFGSAGNTEAQTQPFGAISTTLGADEYPVFTGPPDPNGAYSFVAAGMQGVQATADANGRPSAIALQAFNWGDGRAESQNCGSSPSNCHFPTEQEMWMERNAAILNGNPQVMLWFGLFDILGYPPGEQNPNWIVPPDPAQRWNDLVQAAFDPNVVAPPSPVSAPAGPISVAGSPPATTASAPLVADARFALGRARDARRQRRSGRHHRRAAGAARVRSRIR